MGIDEDDSLARSLQLIRDPCTEHSGANYRYIIIVWSIVSCHAVGILMPEKTWSEKNQA